MKLLTHHKILVFAVVAVVLWLFLKRTSTGPSSGAPTSKASVS